VVYSGFFIVLGFFLFLWAHDAHLRQRIRAAHPPSGRDIPFDGGTLHVLSEGHPSDLAPIVLIHGSSGSARDVMQAFAPHLRAQTQVLAVDRPGIGYSRNVVSDHKLAPPEEQGRAIMQALAKMGISRPVIVGHSWGGSVAMAMAMAYGDKLSGVMTIAPPLYPWKGKPVWYEKMVTTPILGPVFTHMVLTKYGRSQLQAGVSRNFWPEEAPADYAREVGLSLILQPPQFRANAVYSMTLSNNLSHLSENYKAPDCPLVLVSGDQDQTVSCERNIKRFHSNFPTSEIIIYGGGGHMIHHTKAADLSRKLLAMAAQGEV
jgi:pimeloyl-ACP methyl ester carboxylesterase